jgi:hypothetical protein
MQALGFLGSGLHGGSVCAHARRVRWRRRVGGLALATTAALSRDAWAEQKVFSLSYRAGQGCPHESVFVREIVARTSQAKFSESGAGHHFGVEVRQVVGRSVGRIEIREAGGEPSFREVDGTTCEEVVSGLALIAALTLDPEASLSPVAKEAPAVAPPVRKPPPARATKPLEAPRKPWRGAVGVEAGITGGIAPAPFATGTVFVELEKIDTLSFRLALAYGLPVSVAAGERSGQLDWLAGRLQVCPVHLSIVRSLWAAPCAGLEVGRVGGEGLPGGGVDVPHAGMWVWFAAVGGAELVLDLRRVLLRVQGGAMIPFLRHTFIFEQPTVVIHRVGAIAGFVQAGPSIRFP